MRFHHGLTAANILPTNDGQLRYDYYATMMFFLVATAATIIPIIVQDIGLALEKTERLYFFIAGFSLFPCFRARGGFRTIPFVGILIPFETWVRSDLLVWWVNLSVVLVSRDQQGFVTYYADSGNNEPAWATWSEIFSVSL